MTINGFPFLKRGNCRAFEDRRGWSMKYRTVVLAKVYLT